MLHIFVEDCNRCGMCWSLNDKDGEHWKQFFESALRSQQIIYISEIPDLFFSRPDGSVVVIACLFSSAFTLVKLANIHFRCFGFRPSLSGRGSFLYHHHLYQPKSKHWVWNETCTSNVHILRM